MCKVRGTEEGPDEKQINEVGWYWIPDFFVSARINQPFFNGAIYFIQRLRAYGGS